MKWKTQKYADANASGAVSSLITHKIHREMLCRFPDSMNLHTIFSKE
jgi:hypothetical protein